MNLDVEAMARVFAEDPRVAREYEDDMLHAAAHAVG